MPSRAADGSCIRLRPEHRNHVWSYDFVHCRTDDGKAFRTLNILDEYSREFKKVFEENNQILLYASPWPPSGNWAREAMDSSAALAGLNIRTYDKNGATALNEMGAAAVRLSWADLVPSISTGAIGAVLTFAEGGVSGSFWEHFDTFTEIYNFSIPLNFVHISKDTFDGLFEDQQAAVLEAAAEIRDQNWRQSRIVLPRPMHSFPKTFPKQCECCDVERRSVPRRAASHW